MRDYDVIYIGSGHACWHGAFILRQAGKKVALIEQYKNGGTCTNYGCDAKILLDGPFEFRDGLKRYQDLGIETPDINWKKLMAYKHQALDPFDPLLGQMITSMGCDLIKGHGKLVDANTVEVGGKCYTADHIVIGAGARNAKLNIPGKEFTHGSSDFLDLEEMPERLVFIGAGIISMEFACMALDLGKQTTIIEFAPRALAAYPEKYANAIVAKMESMGAKFIFGQGVASVEKTNTAFCVKTADGFAVEADYVLDATGRIANVEDLGLETVGIEATRRGIKVDDHMRTVVPNIYASGDVVDKTVPKLTPTAEFESNYIARHILGIDNEPICYPAVPNMVFTLPRIAQAGVTIDEAKAAPDKYTIVEVPYGKTQEWVNNRELEAEHTFVVDKDGYLAGAALYGAEAGVMIDFLTLVINQKITGKDLGKMIFAFPTTTYILVSELMQVMQ